MIKTMAIKRIYKVVSDSLRKKILEKSNEIRKQLPEYCNHLELFVMNYYNDPDSLFDKDNRIEVDGFTLLYKHTLETVGVGYNLHGERNYIPFVSLAIIK